MLAEEKEEETKCLEFRRHEISIKEIGGAS
jgi:hypothetical protein